MSRIYEAIKVLETERLANGAPERDSIGAMETPERRRFARSEQDIPLTVYGRGPDGSPFYREADAVNTSADGGLLVLRAPVCEGQELLLINNRSLLEQLSLVVRVRSRDENTNEVAVTFRLPNPRFWQLSEPPQSEEPEDEDF